MYDRSLVVHVVFSGQVEGQLLSQGTVEVQLGDRALQEWFSFGKSVASFQCGVAQDKREISPVVFAGTAPGDDFDAPLSRFRKLRRVGISIDVNTGDAQSRNVKGAPLNAVNNQLRAPVARCGRIEEDGRNRERIGVLGWETP